MNNTQNKASVPTSSARPSSVQKTDAVADEVKRAVSQLEHSERGQRASAMLSDFFRSSVINGLDSQNHEAVALLVAIFCQGSSAQSRMVLEELENLINRHPWVRD